MPELPEVETVRRGLARWVEGARIDDVKLNRADLRFPFPKGFAKALKGQTITTVGRRAKYLLFHLSGGMTWLSHLGMTGSYRFADQCTMRFVGFAGFQGCSRQPRAWHEPRRNFL